MKRGFIFDFDGVICDTERFHYVAWKKVAARLNTVFTPEEYLPFRSRGREAVISYLGEKSATHISEPLYSELSAVKSEEFARLTRSVGDGDLIKGVKEFIIKVHDEGYKTAVASSAKSAGNMLDFLALDKYFDAIVDGNDKLRKKPAPDIFLAAANKIGLPPSECYVFEDSEAGVEGALRGNFEVFGIGSSLKRTDIPIYPDFTEIYRLFFR